MASPIANFLVCLQTAWSMRVQLPRAIGYQAVLAARYYNFYLNGNNNTTMGRIRDFNRVNIRFTFDRGRASTTAKIARINSL